MQKVFEWFVLHFEVIYPEQPISDTALLDDPATLKEYAKFLGMFGTRIVDVEKEEVSGDKVKSNLSVVDHANMDFRMNLVRTNNFLIREKREWSAVATGRIYLP